MSYPAFSKVPRLNRPVVITEKIDGTNGQVHIEYAEPYVNIPKEMHEPGELVLRDDQAYRVRAGSRSRWITPDADNHGFAAWVHANAYELVKLGVGHHYGEWWGSGINRGYGLTKGEKRFSLFNTSRWADDEARPACCHVVPVIMTGDGNLLNDLVHWSLEDLRIFGSQAAKGYDKPEGVVVYHTAANALFKVMLEGDSEPKTKVLEMFDPKLGKVSALSFAAAEGWQTLVPEGVAQFMTELERVPA